MAISFRPSPAFRHGESVRAPITFTIMFAPDNLGRTGVQPRTKHSAVARARWRVTGVRNGYACVFRTQPSYLTPILSVTLVQRRGTGHREALAEAYLDSLDANRQIRNHTCDWHFILIESRI